ncbi:MAG: CDP-alcohol phosphatidyltransferase family protein [Oscillospiraceae bacterium]|nr:CDP-alcohol phosphatidyltransferase family protein [Oscillospiraceae bacterium]
MNIPNIISGTRILLVPMFVFCYMQGRLAASLAVLILCALSDVLDGMIARRFNMVTDLGKILDPVADKLIQAAMMLCLSFSFPQIRILLFLHIFRELTLSAMGLYVIRKTGKVCSAKWYGKFCTAFLYAAMLLMLLKPDLPLAFVNALVLCSSVLMVFCLVMYLLEYLHTIKIAFQD